MSGCPLGVNWEVAQAGGKVRISGVVRYDGHGEADAVEFPHLDVEIPEEAYRREVITFAEEARRLFAGVTKDFSDEYDREQYEDFW